MQRQFAAVARALAFVLLALVLCGIIFQFAGYSALEMFQSIADGAFLNPDAWQSSLRWALPLFITASGVVISFRCGYFNVGAQGQFYIGAIGATFVADLPQRCARRRSLCRSAFIAGDRRAARCGRCGPGCCACARARTKSSRR